MMLKVKFVKFKEWLRIKNRILIKIFLNFSKKYALNALIRERQLFIIIIEGIVIVFTYVRVV